MYELEEIEHQITARLHEGGSSSIREALEDGRLQAIPIPVPKPKRREENTTFKIMASALIVSLIAMICYATWRIRDIERMSEDSDLDYCLISIEDFDRDNEYDKTCIDRPPKSKG